MFQVGDRVRVKVDAAKVHKSALDAPGLVGELIAHWPWLHKHAQWVVRVDGRPLICAAEDALEPFEPDPRATVFVQDMERFAVVSRRA